MDIILQFYSKSLSRNTFFEYCMTNIWEQSPVDIFEHRFIKPIESLSQTVPKVEIPVKLSDKLSLSDTSSLKDLTESEKIVLPNRLIIPIKVDTMNETGITAVAVGSCKTMSLMNIILCIVLVLLIASLIVLFVKKYQEYQSSSKQNNQDVNIDENNEEEII